MQTLKNSNKVIDPHSYQYLQKRLIRFGTAAGGMGLMAKPYQTQKANAALAQIRSHAALEQSVIIDLKEDNYSEFKYDNMVENNKAAAIATALLKNV